MFSSRGHRGLGGWEFLVTSPQTRLGDKQTVLEENVALRDELMGVTADLAQELETLHVSRLSRVNLRSMKWKTWLWKWRVWSCSWSRRTSACGDCSACRAKSRRTLLHSSRGRSIDWQEPATRENYLLQWNPSLPVSTLTRLPLARRFPTCMALLLHLQPLHVRCCSNHLSAISIDSWGTISHSTT